MMRSARTGRPPAVLLVLALAAAQTPLSAPPGAGAAEGTWPPEGLAASDHDLVFVSDRSGSSQLHRLDLRTGQVSQVTGHDSPVHGPRWVPSLGSLMVAGEKEGLSWLYRVSAGGQGLEPFAANPAGDEVPDWGPAGDRWVYMKQLGEQKDLYLAAVSGGTPETIRRLTADPSEDKQPRWSPDGERIVFVSSRSGNQDIYTMGLDGAPPRNITAHPALEGHPAWSPDGKRILFYRYEQGDADLYVIDATGGEPANLTAGAGNELVGSWSPDGSWIAFGSARTDDWELYLMPSDGGPARRLTFHAGFDGDPIWIPRRPDPAAADRSAQGRAQAARSPRVTSR